MRRLKNSVNKQGKREIIRYEISIYLVIETKVMYILDFKNQVLDLQISILFYFVILKFYFEGVGINLWNRLYSFSRN